MACYVYAAEAVFCFLFFCFLACASTTEPSPQLCPPSSCGHLKNISSPFRLKGDPQHCGDPDYELVCDSRNKTILSLISNKYYVTKISYDNTTIQVTDVSMAERNGRCPFPIPSLSHVMVDKPEFPYMVESPAWASFANCSKEVKNNSMYVQVPCLSNNNTFIYVIVDQFPFTVGILEISCHYLAMSPVDNLLDSNTDIFELLSRGFSLNWDKGPFWPSNPILYCLRKLSSGDLIYEIRRHFQFFNAILRHPVSWRILSAVLGRELSFLACLDDNGHVVKHFSVVFPMAIVVIGLIQIIKLSIVLAVLGRFVFAPLTICTFLACKLHKIMTNVDIVEMFLRNHQTLVPTRYAYTDIIALTNHFKEKLGQGGFGSVFKGRLPGDRLIAIKMLGGSKCNGEDFISEVSTIGSIHHVNVVKLVGFCSEGSKRALLYEYMPNGSLDKYIFSSNKNSRHKFSSKKLIEIALGIARGIDYLHHGCAMQILHFDIKPHNILLDYCFTPKISDFGLAKLYPRDYSLVTVSAARGTIGYIAPELISRSFGVISDKSDVYSFGMLLLEMAGGRRNVDPKAENTSQIYYPSWIYDQMNPIREGTEIDTNFVIEDVERKLCMVGLWCIQMRPSNRSSISKVIEMLEDDVHNLQMPPKPFVSAPNSLSSKVTCVTSTNEELTSIYEDDQH